MKTKHIEFVATPGFKAKRKEEATMAEVSVGELMGAPHTKARYSLSELMSHCDPNAPLPDDIKIWDSMVPVGKEW